MEEQHHVRQAFIYVVVFSLRVGNALFLYAVPLKSMEPLSELSCAHDKAGSFGVGEQGGSTELVQSMVSLG